jgi:hypothetical protein
MMSSTRRTGDRNAMELIFGYVWQSLGCCIYGLFPMYASLRSGSEEALRLSFLIGSSVGSSLISRKSRSEHLATLEAQRHQSLSIVCCYWERDHVFNL